MKDRAPTEAGKSEWDWLFEISGKFSDDFFALGRDQPPLPDQRSASGPGPQPRDET